MNTKNTTETPPAEEPLGIYEVTCDTPVKVGGVIASQGSRLNLTKAQADALNAIQPETVKFLGV